MLHCKMVSRTLRFSNNNMNVLRVENGTNTQIKFLSVYVKYLFVYTLYMLWSVFATWETHKLYVFSSLFMWISLVISPTFLCVRSIARLLDVCFTQLQCLPILIILCIILFKYPNRTVYYNIQWIIHWIIAFDHECWLGTAKVWSYLE